MAETRKKTQRKQKRSPAKASRGSRPKAAKSKATRRTTRSAAHGQKRGSTPSDAISLLKDDHRRVRALLERLVSTQGGARRQQVLGQIEAELELHTEIEEQIFYPAYRDSVAKKEDRKLYYEALEEHHAVDLVLPDTQKADPESEAFAGRAKVLKELVEHHAKEEESDMFPRARRAMTTAQLRDLGTRMADLKRQRKGAKDAYGGAFETVKSLVGMGR